MNGEREYTSGNTGQVLVNPDGMLLGPTRMQRGKLYNWNSTIYGEISKNEIDAVIFVGAKKRVFSNLRPKEDLVIRQFVLGQCVFVPLPTGTCPTHYSLLWLT